MKSPAEFRIARVRETTAPASDMDTPEKCAIYWREHVAKDFDPMKEHLVVLLLNAKLRLMGHVLVSMGALSETLAHPREVLRPCVIAAAYAFVLMHNHPSGDATPSDADRRLTMRMKEAGELMQVRLMDHVIVGDATRFSFRECGLL